MTIERKVGLFFTIAVIVLGVMVETGEKWNPFKQKVPYKTYLASVTGLKVGDPVKLVGVDVGKIKKVTILEEQVQIDFEVEPGTKIKKDTVAMLRLTNLLGGQFLGLTLGTPGSPLLEPGSTVTGKNVANIDIIVDNVSDLTRDAKVLITDLTKNQNEVMHKIAVILDDNRTNIRDGIANFASITRKFDSGDGSLALLLNDKVLYTDTTEAIASIKNISGKIEKGEGTFGKLVNDDALYADARSALTTFKDGVSEMNGSFKEIKEVAGKINRGEGTLGKLVNEDVLYTDIKEASKNISDITGKINRGEGTIGKLVNEDKLYKDATATLKKTEKAVEGMGDSGPISVLGSIIGTLF